jgi:hypothetical protein
MQTFGGEPGARQRRGFRDPRRSPTRVRAAAVSVGALALLALGSAAALAQQPPTLFVNPRLQPIVATCANTQITEIAECPSTERQHIRSERAAILGWGATVLHGATSFETIRCTAVFTGAAWREHENAVETAQIRSYGLIEGWSDNQCAAPTMLKSLEKSSGLSHLSISVTDEPPLEEELREAEYCNTAEVQAGHTRLGECPRSTEREVEELPENVVRQKQTMPWKEEVVWGRPHFSEEEAVQLRIGMASFNECGPGEDEETEGNPERCQPRQLNTKCYPASQKFAEVPAGCIKLNVVIPQIPAEMPVYGSLETTWRNGAGSASDPGRFEAEEGYSGTLLPNEGSGSSFSLSGTIKEIGETNQGLIQYKEAVRGGEGEGG